MYAKALIIHKLETSTSNPVLSLTAHDIHHREEAATPILGPGKCLSMDDKKALGAILNEATSTRMEFLSERCLVQGKQTLVWYRPRQKETINIAGQERTVPLPSLVFTLHRGQLYVRAYAGDRRPTPDTMTLYAGLPNIMGGSHWCSGGNRLPELPTQSDIERVQEVFFRSPFTHWGGENVQGDQSMESWFEDLDGKPRFPMRSLTKTRDSLGEWISRILKEDIA